MTPLSLHFRVLNRVLLDPPNGPFWGLRLVPPFGHYIDLIRIWPNIPFYLFWPFWPFWLYRYPVQYPAQNPPFYGVLFGHFLTSFWYLLLIPLLDHIRRGLDP